MGRYDWHKEEINKLIKILAATKTSKEIEKIFDFVLTPREINDIARRLKALEMLGEGKSYADIQSELGMSPIVISRISGKIGFGFSASQKAKLNDKILHKNKTSKEYTLRYKGAPTISEVLDLIFKKL